MGKQIQHSLFFSQSQQDVWEYLTRPELIELWLMKNDFQPVVGHRFNFWTKPMPNLDFDGIVYGTVLEVIPYEKLSYSWKGGPGNGQITLDSIVAWTLHANGSGTELRLLHTGFKEMENMMMFDIMNQGWLKNMHKIAERLNIPGNGAVHS